MWPSFAYAFSRSLVFLLDNQITQIQIIHQGPQESKEENLKTKRVVSEEEPYLYF